MDIARRDAYRKEHVLNEAFLMMTLAFAQVQGYARPELLPEPW
jgi:hypothetical protein